jgi:hypothetical protein
MVKHILKELRAHAPFTLFVAVTGIIIMAFSLFPHAGHVLLSTWASLFHIIMALGGSLNLFSYFVILPFLFIAVWVPCCVSDIVFPLLFVKKSKQVDFEKGE